MSATWCSRWWKLLKKSLLWLYGLLQYESTYTVVSQIFSGSFLRYSKAWSFFKRRTNSTLSIFSLFFKIQDRMNWGFELLNLSKSDAVQCKNTLSLQLNPCSLASNSWLRLGEVFVFLKTFFSNKLAFLRFKQCMKLLLAKFDLRTHSWLVNLLSGRVVGHIWYLLRKHTWFDWQNWGSIVVFLQRLDIKLLKQFLWLCGCPHTLTYDMMKLCRHDLHLIWKISTEKGGQGVQVVFR